jgi:hypothetical protein
MTEETEKKKRPDLGIAVPVTNKKTPQSYDLSGNIVVEGKKWKFGAYRSTASGNGKMAKGSEYYYFYRVEPLDEAAPAAAPAEDAASFNPSELEK